MTEVITEYKVATKNAGVKWCRCPDCLEVYGYEEKGGAYLRVGRLKVQSMRAECAGCGKTVWWYSSDRHLKKITEGRTTSPPNITP